jgi:hypothetical protein
MKDRYTYTRIHKHTSKDMYTCIYIGAELRLDHAVKQLFPNSSGTRLVVVDASNSVYLFNPVTGGGVNQVTN